MADYKAYQRYFNNFTQAINKRVFQDLYQWFFSCLQFDNYTLDFDSTIMTRYGEQQGAKKAQSQEKGTKIASSLTGICCLLQDDCKLLATAG